MQNWTLADVAAHWDHSPEYDAQNATIDSYMRRFTDSAPLFAIPEHSRVLDIDCRTGNGTVFFQKRHPAARFTCVAMAPTFVERAKANLAAHSVAADVSLLQNLPLPFNDGSFDVVLSYETLEHVPWPARYLAELSRLLALGGVAVLTTPNRLWEPVHRLSAALHLDHGEGPHRMLPRGEILRLLRDAGLRVETERTFVLVPAGPQWLIATGKWMERMLPESILRAIALRRTFICAKS